MVNEKDEIQKKALMETMPSSKIKYPYFFTLQRDNKTSYLLGTNHEEPLESLPKVCLDIIDNCTFYVTEEINHTDEEVDRFYHKAVVRSESKPWVHLLSRQVVSFLEKGIAAFYDTKHNGFRKTIHQLKIWAAYLFASYGYAYLALSACEAYSTKTELALDDEPVVGMDHALIERFNKNLGGLEGRSDKILGYKREGGKIKDLLRLYDELTSENDDDGDDDVSKIMENYREGIMFYDPSEIEEVHNDKEIVLRTIHWLPNILAHHHRQDETILFGVGNAHLIGEYGLLCLLPKLGFSISRVRYDGTFEPYTYPFTSEAIARITLSQERRMSHYVNQTNKQLILYQYTGLQSSKPIKIVDAFFVDNHNDSALELKEVIWDINKNNQLQMT